MAVELKTEEQVLVTQTLNFVQPVTDDEKRPLGLACAAVVEDFPWDQADPGHILLQQILKDVKNALGVRVSKKSKDNADKAPAKVPTGKKRGRPKKVASNGNGETASPPVEAPAPQESDSPEAEVGASEGPKSDASAPIHDPFAVPAGT